MGYIDSNKCYDISGGSCGSRNSLRIKEWCWCSWAMLIMLEISDAVEVK